MSNNSVLPTDLPQSTSKCLDSINFSSSDIAINQDFDLGTLVLANYLLLTTKFVNRLMGGLKLQGFLRLI